MSKVTREQTQIRFNKIMAKIMDEADPNLIKQYLVESFDNDWEGFDAREKAVLKKLVMDLCEYVQLAKNV